MDDTLYKELFFKLFPEMNTQLAEKISSDIIISFVPKGDYICREGEKPLGFICLLSGGAKLVKSGVSGRGQIIRMVKPLGIVGYRALFADENYRSSAQTLDDSVIAFIEKNVFFKILRSNGEISLHILKSIAHELGVSNIRTITLTQKHIRGRLADSLIFLIDTYGYYEGTTIIAATLSREDLAQLSSMTTSNAIRTLSAFASENMVELNGKKIKIIDKEKLQKTSELG